jgi:hypothetical protein
MSTDNRNICDQIAEDAKNDAISFDGQPFTGKTVGTYFGNHGASKAALANFVKFLLEEIEELKATQHETANLK